MPSIATECTNTSTYGRGDGIPGTSAERSLIATASRPGRNAFVRSVASTSVELVAQDAVLVERLDRVEVGEDLLAQRVRGVGVAVRRVVAQLEVADELDARCAAGRRTPRRRT